MKALKKVLIPLVLLMLAMSLVFAVACNDDVDTGKDTYTVTFDLNYEGAPEAETAQTVDGKVAEPDEPERADYAFDGWFTAAEGGEEFDFDTVLTADTTLYAHWTEDEQPDEPVEYTVTFNLNYEGAPAAETAQTVDGKVAEPDEPERADYAFDGWFTAAEGGEEFDFDTVLTADTTLYAHWTEAGQAQEYTVIFNFCNGSSVLKQAVLKGETVNMPSTPTYGDYKFDGWYTEAIGGEKWDFDSKVTANTTLYAHWLTWTDNASINFDSISSSLPAGIYTDNSGKKLNDGESYTHTVNANVTVVFPEKVRFESGSVLNTQATSYPIQLTLTGNGLFSIVISGTGASSSNDAWLIFNTAETADGGYESAHVANKVSFSDWTIQNLEAGTYYIYTSGSIRITSFIIKELVTVNAAPDKIAYTVTFDGNGEEDSVTDLPAPITGVEETSTIDKPNDPSRRGYLFDGWYTAAEGGEKWDFDIDTVTDNITLYAHWLPDPDYITYTVTFMVDSDVYTTQKVEKGNAATEIPVPDKGGHQALGWFEENASTAYNFSTPITANLTLHAKYSVVVAEILDNGAYNESLYVVWQEGAPSSAKVEYKLSGTTDWKTVDAPLVRAQSATVARVDIIGLTAGTYDVKITSSGGTQLNVDPIKVTAYDRSGYAHFNYTDGVGAYNDDGTLKDGALVIYVTDTNKNDILDYAYVNGQKVDISKYMVTTQEAQSGGVTVGQQTGIGELLNNRRYSGNDRWNVGISALCEAYGSVAIRIIGTVSAEVAGTMESSINGLTTYNSTENGGSVGDNGRMARMVNAHDLTIEGVGDDASIFGWGVHFISSYYSGKAERMGTSFEVRNITFANYPEDAVGMEGEQGILSSGGSVSGSSSASSDLYSPVERCWVHNNTFFPGYASKPAEDDKAEGDGSCDFKRGQYFTASYNWFEYCHKTNLVGSSDSSLQYNLTYHHNVWWQCSSRIPLTRQANVHFYNNYVYINAADTSSPYSWVKVSPSYVHSLRANCYIFSEANYYDGVKNLTDGKNGGAAKGWNNVYYANYGTNSIEDVTSREQKVSNSCKFIYRNIDYSSFDTDPELFYYNTETKSSDCLLDDAVTARQKALMYAGANGHGVSDTAVNQYTPTSSISVTENGLTVALPTVKGDSEVSGVLFRGIAGTSSGTIKFKGQGITFTLATQAQLTVTTSTSGEPAPELIGADGTVYAHKFEGTLTIVLEPGTYVIASGQKDKEAVITSMRFDDTAASSQARIDSAILAVNAIPETAELTETYATALKAAQSAYGALTASERTAFDAAHGDIVAKLNKAIEDYNNLQIAHARELINAIGEVNKDSYNAIYAAQTAYDALTSEQKAQLTEEKAILDAAVTAFEKFAVQNVIDLIAAFADKVEGVNEGTDRATIEGLLDEADTILAAYNALSEDAEGEIGQQSQVTNYSDLTAAVAKLEQIYSLYEFADALEYFNGHTVTMNDANAIAELKGLYEELTETQKALLTPAQAELYESVLAAFENLQAELITVNFLGGQPSSDLFKHVGEKQNSKSAKFFVSAANEEFATGLKFESSTKLELTLTSAKVLTLYFNTDKSPQNIKIDGTNYDCVAVGDNPYVVTITLEAGTHTIERGTSEMWLYYATLAPAA